MFVPLNVARKTAEGEPDAHHEAARLAPSLRSSGLSSLASARAAGPAASLPKGLPADLWEILVPPENPVTPEKVALGRKLYFDKRLSKDGTVSCATCHDPAKGFADGKKVAEGIGGKKGARNSPTVLNAVFYEFQFWDGRAATLEEQAKGPMINPVEMGMDSHDAVVKVVRGVPEYQAGLRARSSAASPRIDDVVAAIATFERTVVSGDSAFDRFHAGRQDAPCPSRRSAAGSCGTARPAATPAIPSATPPRTSPTTSSTTSGWRPRPATSRASPARRPRSADPQELAFDPDFTELGRFVATKQPKDIGAFKTPGLRDIALTAPYMHDGSEATLLDV